MVIRIDVSDDKGEHFELREDGTIRLFGTTTDGDDRCIVVSERQASFLRAALTAQADILKVKR